MSDPFAELELLVKGPTLKPQTNKKPSQRETARRLNMLKPKRNTTPKASSILKTPKKSQKTAFQSNKSRTRRKRRLSRTPDRASKRKIQNKEPKSNQSRSYKSGFGEKTYLEVDNSKYSEYKMGPSQTPVISEKEKKKSLLRKLNRSKKGNEEIQKGKNLRLKMAIREEEKRRKQTANLQKSDFPDTKKRILQDSDDMLSRKERQIQKKSRKSRQNRGTSYDFVGGKEDFETKNRKRIEARKRNLLMKYNLRNEIWGKDTSKVVREIQGNHNQNQNKNQTVIDKKSRDFRNRAQTPNSQNNQQDELDHGILKKSKPQTRNQKFSQHSENNFDNNDNANKKNNLEKVKRRNLDSKPKSMRWVDPETYEDPKLTQMKQKMRLQKELLKGRRGKSPLQGESSYVHEKRLREIRHLTKTPKKNSKNSTKVTEKELFNEIEDLAFDNQKFFELEREEEKAIQAKQNRRKKHSPLKLKYDLESGIRLPEGQERFDGKELQKQVEQDERENWHPKQSNLNRILPFHTTHRQKSKIFEQQEIRGQIKRERSKRKIINPKTEDNLKVNAAVRKNRRETEEEKRNKRRGRRKVETKRKDNGIFFGDVEDVRMTDNRPISLKFQKKRDVSPKITNPNAARDTVEERIRKYRQKLKTANRNESIKTQEVSRETNNKKKLTQRERYNRHQRDLLEKKEKSKSKRKIRTRQKSKISQLSGYNFYEEPNTHRSHSSIRGRSTRRKRELTPKITRQSHNPRNQFQDSALNSQSYSCYNRENDSAFGNHDTSKNFPETRTEPNSLRRDNSKIGDQIVSERIVRSPSPKPNRKSIERRKMLYREMLGKKDFEEHNLHQRKNRFKGDSSSHKRIEMTPTRKKLFEEFRKSQI